MNKLALQGPLWLASDLHLGPATPATAEAFLGSLQAAADEASALLLPGDIFDAWIGDDVIRAAPPGWRRCCMASARPPGAFRFTWAAATATS